MGETFIHSQLNTHSGRAASCEAVWPAGKGWPRVSGQSHQVEVRVRLLAWEGAQEAVVRLTLAGLGSGEGRGRVQGGAHGGHRISAPPTCPANTTPLPQSSQTWAAL